MIDQINSRKLLFVCIGARIFRFGKTVVIHKSCQTLCHTKGHPVFAKARRLCPEKLQIVNREYADKVPATGRSKQL